MIDEKDMLRHLGTATFVMGLCSNQIEWSPTVAAYYIAGILFWFLGTR